MHADLKTLLTQQLADGLKRKAITKPSDWAQRYRVIPSPITKNPQPWTFRYHPWSKEMHDALFNGTTDLMIGQKAAQMGYTETALNLTFYAIDIKRHSVLYVLPSQRPDAVNFSAARFDPALEESAHLRSLFSDTKNAQHKRAGSANLFIRGSRKRSHLVSMPVNIVLLDEVDEMTQENIPAVFERMMGQLEKGSFLLSTPTVPGKGISKRYEESTQEQFFFPCPACSRHISFKFPESIQICGERPNDPRTKESTLICHECKAQLSSHIEAKADYLSKGHWVPGYSDRTTRGFHVNQLYSTMLQPSVWAEKYLKSLQNASDEQEFYNSTLGLPHLTAGAQITDEDIDLCTKSYVQRDKPGRDDNFITMGVDVGKHLHVELTAWSFDQLASIDPNLCSTARVIKVAKLDHFEELDKLIHQFNVRYTVIDANPERRKALEFANRFYKMVSMCFYVEGIHGKELKINNEALTVSVDRTSWLDLSLSRFKQQSILLPRDIGLEYITQLKAPMRIFKNDQHGNPVARYIHDEKNQDHFAHARTYSEIALTLALANGRSQSM